MIKYEIHHIFYIEADSEEEAMDIANAIEPYEVHVQIGEW